MDKEMRKKVITKQVFEMMSKGTEMMILLNDDFTIKEVLTGRQIDEWNYIYGLTSNISRVVGHKTSIREYSFYVLHFSNEITTTYIPIERFKVFPVYEDFMLQLEKDLAEDE